jgi:leucyl aminopeptidase
MHSAFAKASAQAIPVWFVTKTDLDAVLGKLDAQARPFAKASGFEAKPGQHVLLPGKQGALAGVLFGLEGARDSQTDLFRPGKLADVLPPGIYRFANAPHDARLAALAFALGAYRFGRYRNAKQNAVQLALPESIDGAELTAIVEAVTLARDLINTPSNDMGPAELEAAARKLGKQHSARIAVTAAARLAKQFPLVQAVGAGSARAPRMIDLTWGSAKHPKVTLVGKGVCFDTGGLDIKNDAGMLNMKKDMGGAATALALGHMLMSAGAKIRLRIVVPAVENAISGTSFRPRDIYRSRKGISVEIGNTDAEGRLILADALALADEDGPDLMVDFATLTGAARVALGPDLPPMFTDDDRFANEMTKHAAAENDPVWRMPLWSPYETMLDSKVADTNNVSTGGFGGAITAALFLRKFVERAGTWAHFDIFAWTPSARPGRPEGGECQTARALFALIKERYGTT